jgi:hypothetical protein
LLGTNIPQLPQKTFISWFRIKTDSEIDDRRIGLDSYLKDLVSRIDVLNSQPLTHFLQIQKNAPEITLKPPTTILELKDFYLSIRDIDIDYQQGYMLIAGAEMSLLSRVDAFLGNLKLPWEEEVNSFTDKQYTPVGSL